MKHLNNQLKYDLCFVGALFVVLYTIALVVSTQGNRHQATIAFVDNLSSHSHDMKKQSIQSKFNELMIVSPLNNSNSTLNVEVERNSWK